MDSKYHHRFKKVESCAEEYKTKLKFVSMEVILHVNFQIAVAM